MVTITTNFDSVRRNERSQYLSLYLVSSAHCVTTSHLAPHVTVPVSNDALIGLVNHSSALPVVISLSLSLKDAALALADCGTAA